MKHLEDTPWFICDEGDTNLCAYVDTDSNYFNAEPLLNHLYPNFKDLSNEEKDSKLEIRLLKTTLYSSCLLFLRICISLICAIIIN